MNRNIKVLKNALDLFKSYLDTYATDNQDFFYHQASIEALSEIEKCEPVAYYYRCDFGDDFVDGYSTRMQLDSMYKDERLTHGHTTETPLYTSPISKEWLSLSDKGIEDLAKQNKYWYGFNSDRFDWRAYSSDLIYELKKLNFPEKG